MFVALVLTFCRVVLALVFALSVGGKIIDIRAFQEAITDFRLLPPGWSRAAAWGFVLAESAVVVSMVVGGPTLVAGFLLALALLSVFSLALVVALRRDTRVSCNCFGRTERRISPYDVLRNALLALCALTGAWALSVPLQSAPIAGTALVGLMAACFAVFVTNLKDVIETLRQPFTPFS